MVENPEFVTLPLSCRCKQLTVHVDVPASSLPLDLYLCHCNTCNAVSGQLCLTVCPVPKGSKPIEVSGKAKGYRTSSAIERYFCETCGSSVYEDASGMEPGLVYLETGALTVGEVDVLGKSTPVFQLKEHLYVGDTKDGGLRDWLTEVPAWKGWTNSSEEIPSGKYYGRPSDDGDGTDKVVSSTDELRCSCKCGGVEFFISRPKDTSHHYATPSQTEVLASPVTIPKSPEWWMPAEGAKFHAFLCACNDCRLSSGYEVSAWAIIPRNNFRVSNGTTTTAAREAVSPQNVSSLQSQSTMRDHESSPGCHRQFCGECGAKLSFFNTETMPNLINVAVGLMKGRDGPRVEEWLEWQTDEIGYHALAQNGAFVDSLSNGMKKRAFAHGPKVK